MREVRGEESPLCSLPKDTVADHFEQVFAERLSELPPPPAGTVLPPTQQEDPTLVEPISKATILARLRRVGNTAPGPDGVTYAAIRAKDRGAHILAEVFRVCLEQKKIPAAWKESRTILIHKKGDKKDLGNWRPISLSSCLYKLYTGILADRLARWAGRTGAVSSVQKGFMPAEGCLEHNFLLQQCLDDARARGKELTVTWLDLRNAFGSVPHTAILSMLRQHGVHNHLVDVVQEAYSGCTTTITTSSGETRAVAMDSGVKQGDPLSPMTFNLVIEILIRSAERLALQHGYILHGHKLCCLAYADDLVLIGKSRANIQALLDIIGEAASWLGLDFNAAKCATLSIRDKQARRVATSIQGQPINFMADGEAYQHLGVPTGLYVDQTPEATIEHMIQDLQCVEMSLLSEWQKLDAIRTFILPQAQFVLLTARIAKKHFELLDRAIKRVAKAALHLPRRASPELVFIPSQQGGANIMPLSELADVGAVTRAFKMLTCPDPLVQQVAEQSMKRTVTEAVGAAPSNREVTNFLSGARMNRPSHSFATIWSGARNASRRLQNKIGAFSWTWGEEHDLCLSMSMAGQQPDTVVVNSEQRGEVHRSIRVAIQNYFLRRLLNKPVQGKVLDAASLDAASNHFLTAGRHTRFCDWRFVHRARLGVLPLNGCLLVPGRARTCRRCDWAFESTAHVLCHCQRHSRAWRNRHGAVIKALVDEMPAAKKTILSLEKTVRGTGSRLLPDMVLLDEEKKQAVIVDVCCPFENRREALATARAGKITKYTPLVENLRGRGYSAVCDAVVVGALGSWDPANAEALNLLGIPSKRRPAVKRKAVSDVIRWSRDIYVEHVSGHRQYTDDVTLNRRAP